MKWMLTTFTTFAFGALLIPSLLVAFIARVVARGAILGWELGDEWVTWWEKDDA